MAERFAPGVVEHLGYYVYLLIDPRDGAIFYVGKGVNNRCFDHILVARKTDRDEFSEFSKLERIRAIEAAGHRVRIEVLRHGLDEPTAFHVESAAIDLLPDLTNAVKGHHSERWNVEHLNGVYGAKPVVIAPEHRVILIRVAREYRPDITDAELYEKTRSWWRIAERRTDLRNPKAPEWAFSVAGGVVRRVYKITGWEEPTEEIIAGDERRRGRRAFIGHRDEAMEEQYLWGDVSAYLVPGGQNPIGYANCGGTKPPAVESTA